MNIQSGFCKRLLLVLFAAVIAVCFYTISQVHRVSLMENGGRSFVKAQVISIVQDHKQAGDIYIGDQTVQLKLLTGEHAGETVQATSSSAYLYGVHCTVGMKVIAIVSESSGESVTSVYGYNRAPALYAVVGLFLLSILIIGGKRGLYAVIGLLFTFVGGSINTIVMFYAYDYEYLQLINLFDMAIEIMQGISASMGVILTVPLVSFIGAWMIANRRRDIS